MKRPKTWLMGILMGSLWLTMGCSPNDGESAQAQPSGPGESREQGDRTVTVDVAIAEAQTRSRELNYSGTTQPLRRVSLRARSDGQLLNLNADVGDPVFQGQVIARVEDTLLLSELAGVEAEVSVRQSEVEEARNQRIEAEFRVEEIRAELDQAEVDARRLKNLAGEGAIPRREAELAQTRVRTLEQQLRSAQEQVRIRDRAVASAQQRVGAQEAVVAGVQQRLSYTDVPSPLNAVVLERLLEPGDVVQSGDVILELGDFSEVEIRIEIPDRDRSQISLGQAVDVTLDAFPNQEFVGRVSRIFPNADPVARLIPVQITLRNPDVPNGELGGGLLARVTLNTASQQLVTIPERALEISAQGDNTLFIVEGNESETTVSARRVELGEREDDEVEILQGLAPGEQFIVRSDRPLRDGQTVRRSFLSQPRNE
ncbi:efflux RND transporter periplasmic adaptor subunit [Phormidium yuhuli AB48]|uniref:Efflux RND transporter periplasmic adaptor subunit n=1 Tax=Phormidium yuhuli AB48 TaxID=2940671 RepID=A0ABY5AT01_9CYAN|nr:efflux RND transporter periplasmic adaptor subunit [Phormidium yuhuli]USR91973.1 efflux RND transporter periplasmic adaptor subunit [Phormidium yuhuli AB48]